ncbi:MAG: lytic transglycosylase domain-containing protein [Croceitalea sp.]|nr:lytic transglycosylase domain-containing protein [Croceitalea sp.]
MMTLPWTDISRICKEFEINPKIIAAIVMQESAGNPYATRYEDHYRWTLDIERFARKNRISRDTENMQQKTSWGLMQIMGGLARELGFEGPLVRLCEPEINLRLGIKHILNLKQRYSKNLSDVIAAYNAGSPRKGADGLYVNNSYVIRVNKFVKEM